MERMNTDASNQSSSAGPSTPTNSRKERGAIAAQACESCRSRKQRCSEERPKCASCQRMNLECKYREPQPTKKDKTLVEILERLKGLEGDLRSLGDKVDSLSASTARGGGGPPGIYGSLHSSSHPPHVAQDTGRSSSWPPSTIHTAGPTPPSTADHQAQYVSATHMMLSWPVIKSLLERSGPIDPNLDLAAAEKVGAVPVLGAKGQPIALSTDIINDLAVDSDQVDGFQVEAVGHSSALDMSWERMQQLTKAYFDTFNLLYPIMDRHQFQSETLPAIASHGFDDGSISTLACLVFALGQVVLSATEGAPLEVRKGRSSGMKGGTADHPPGLSLFNEARRRMGFNLTPCSLENVQIFCLAALYYGSCCRHTEFWRMTLSASLACQALLTSNPEELSSHKGDLLRRAFWHCAIMETALNLELSIPLTGLDKLEELVGLPDFSGSFSEEDYLANQAAHFQEHFASEIVLRRLLVEFHNTLSRTLGPNSTQGQTSLTRASAPSITSAISTTKQLAGQLDQWRGLLPVYMRWDDEHPGALPTSSLPDYAATIASSGMAFSYAADMQTACLRTRYYYVKYLIYRPYVYKALHHPDRMTNDDAEGVAQCLKASLRWPITMPPTSYHKRLIPCLFFWTQNLLGILVLLHLTQQVPILIRIRATLLGSKFDQDARESVILYMNWIRDLRDVDSNAKQCWTVLKGIYPLEEGT
ncbi:hypothetical protein F4780DRAFT_755800 [Xylariomycetidae sp. FL0641]|nr:hypothetical protein F4780DRAFT_755800 [Xylariomycetidae sp. FL0641]